MPHTNAIDRITLLNKYERASGPTVRKGPGGEALPPMLPPELMARAEKDMGGLLPAERRMLGAE